MESQFLDEICDGNVGFGGENGTGVVGVVEMDVSTFISLVTRLKAVGLEHEILRRVNVRVYQDLPSTDLRKVELEELIAEDDSDATMEDGQFTLDSDAISFWDLVNKIRLEYPGLSTLERRTLETVPCLMEHAAKNRLNLRGILNKYLKKNDEAFWRKPGPGRHPILINDGSSRNVLIQDILAYACQGRVGKVDVERNGLDELATVAVGLL